MLVPLKLFKLEAFKNLASDKIEIFMFKYL